MRLINNKLHAFVAIAMVIVFSACSEDDVKDLIKINQDIKIDETYNFDLGAEDPVVYEQTETLNTDALDGATVTDIKVKELFMTITNYNDAYGDDIALESFSINHVQAGTSVNYVGPLPLKPIEGTRFDLTNLIPSTMSLEASLLEDPEGAQLKSIFTFNKTPLELDIRVELTFEVEATAN